MGLTRTRGSRRTLKEDLCARSQIPVAQSSAKTSGHKSASCRSFLFAIYHHSMLIAPLLATPQKQCCLIIAGGFFLGEGLQPCLDNTPAKADSYRPLSIMCNATAHKMRPAKILNILRWLKTEVKVEWARFGADRIGSDRIGSDGMGWLGMGSLCLDQVPPRKIPSEHLAKQSSDKRWGSCCCTGRKKCFINIQRRACFGF